MGKADITENHMAGGTERGDRDSGGGRDRERDRDRSNGDRSVRPNSPDVPGLEVLLQNVIAERNALRLQNDQLWKIIEKQRVIIGQLQVQVQGGITTHGVAAGGDAPLPPGMLGSDGLYNAEGTAALTGIGSSGHIPVPPAGQQQGSGPSPRKGSAGHRERSVSERPVSSHHEQDSPRKRTVSEGRDSGINARRRSQSDREAINLPSITIQAPSTRKLAPGSAGSSGRQRSGSVSSQKGAPSSLPPVPGATNAGLLQRKTSGGSMIGSGSNVGVYELPLEERSSSQSTVLSSSLTSEPGSMALGDAQSTSARDRPRPSGSARAERRSKVQNFGEIEESAHENGDTDTNHLIVAKSGDGRRRRPVSGRGGSPEKVQNGKELTTQRSSPKLAPHQPPHPQQHHQPTETQTSTQDASEDASAPVADYTAYVLSRKDSLDTTKQRVQPQPPQPPRVRVLQRETKPHSTSQTPGPAPSPSSPTPPQSQPSPGVSTLSSSPEQTHPVDNSSEDSTRRFDTTSKYLGSNMSISLGVSASVMDLNSDTSSSTSAKRAAKENALKAGLKYADQVNVSVVGSQIKLNDKGREVISFLISVREARGSQPAGTGRTADTADVNEMWRIEKSVTSKIGKLPDKSLFTTHSPSKSDQRKVALELYLQNVKTLCRDSGYVMQFLCTDIVETDAESRKDKRSDVVKEGYLFKKGKNFGAWKSRYFTLSRKSGMPTLDYFESQKDRSLLGTIRLKYVFVSKQEVNSRDDTDGDYRHAFCLTEYKKSCFMDLRENGKDIFTENKVVSRHILCAENDHERDEWVECLAKEINSIRPIGSANTTESTTQGAIAENVVVVSKDEGRTDDVSLRSATVTFDTPADLAPPQTPVDESDTGQPEPPQRTASIAATTNVAGGQPVPSSPTTAMGGMSSPGMLSSSPTSKSSSALSGRRAFIDDNERILSQPEPPALVTASRTPTQTPGSADKPSDKADKTNKKSKRMTTFNWGKKAHAPAPARDPSRRIFGVPLEVAVANSRVSELPLPSVVYRCIEYLDAKKANEEEGIYRLSGSSSVIQGLKAGFDSEGDVDLVGSGEYYDVHAVAGLLKLYLRELPSPILTKDLQRSFLHVMDLPDRTDRVTELSRLCSLLPLCNYLLLKTLIAHLVRVVRRCDINKMTVRNVGIVFSPTVGVPAGVFGLMMSEFWGVFWWDGREETRAGAIEDAQPGKVDPANAAPNTSEEEAEDEEQSEEEDEGMEAEVTGQEGQPTSPPQASHTNNNTSTGDLPQPVRREKPNSAKRRARQTAGMGLRLDFDSHEMNGGMPFAGGSAPGTPADDPLGWGLVGMSLAGEMSNAPTTQPQQLQNTAGSRPVSGKRARTDSDEHLNGTSREPATNRVVDRVGFDVPSVSNDEMEMDVPLALHPADDDDEVVVVESEGELESDEEVERVVMDATDDEPAPNGKARVYDAWDSDGGSLSPR
ncbi:hypothetical protein BC832DRAFT_468798 [Gaertneriomyces semiglobifer]|nr:hypothetical protein BC832DRAFT_468798 [Gaertneriomyces semiglobifer]